MDEHRADVAIIGAGPGGSTLAALLASRGIGVTILDRETFPRDKVCGEFLSWDALPILDEIGALRRIDEAGAPQIDRCAIMLPRREYRFQFPFPARGISRKLLDETLLDRAREEGASVLTGWSATRVEPRGTDSGFILARNREGSELKINARVIIGAWGRWGRLDMQLQRGFVREKRRRHFGFKRHFSAKEHDEGIIRLYSFHRGYLGVSPVENRETNVCGLVHASRVRSMKERWEGLTRDLRTESEPLEELFRDRPPAQDEFLTSEPVIFTAREPYLDGMFLIGDAAGMIDPLAGNGMAMAIQSALLAAGAVVQRLSGGRLAELSGRLYAKHYADWFHSRISWSRRGAAVLSRPRLLRAAGTIAPEPALGEFLARKTRADMNLVERNLEAWRKGATVDWR